MRARYKSVHDRADAAIEIGTVGLQGAASESVTSLADRDGAHHDPFHHRGEDVVAGVDGVLDVAQLKGETDLAVLGVFMPGAE